MSDLWPWLTIAGLGALHGLNPATGWLFVAACGHGSPVRRALLPIALGQVASTVLVATTALHGLPLDRGRVQAMAAVVLVAAAACRCLHKAGRGVSIGSKVGLAGIALSSFLVATAHGTGLMLVPALVPLCGAGATTRAFTASGSLLLGVAAVGVHLAAMLATTGIAAVVVCRGWALSRKLSSAPTAGCAAAACPARPVAASAGSSASGRGRAAGAGG